VPRLVLHLREQDRLAAQGRRAADPVPLRLHADDLGVRVLRDLAHKRAPVGLGHPVVGLDLVFRVDLGLEAGELGRIFRGGRVSRVLDVEALRVHRASFRPSGGIPPA